MAVGSWTLTNAAKTKLLDGTFDIDSDTWKMGLLKSTTTISSSSTSWAGVSGDEVATANGYTGGGKSITLTLTNTSGTVKVDISSDPMWTASGGDFSARYAVIYEDGGDILCYCLLDTTPADVTVKDGNDLTIAANATNGVFTLT